jgi:hypothetical protein
MVLGRRRGGLALLLLVVFAAGTALGHVLAAVHPAIVVGIGAAIGAGAMALMLALRGLAVLGMGTVAVMLGMALGGAMALMLGMVGMALLRGSGGLRHDRSDEGEGRRGGDENGLHDDGLLMD